MTPEEHEQAACRGMDLNLFFPDHGGNASLANISKAKAVCARCPVIEACLTDALKHDWVVGVYGGTTEIERARIRTKRTRHPRRWAGIVTRPGVVG